MSSKSETEHATDTAGGAAFGTALGPKGLYISPTLQQRLDLIEHLIEFGRQIIILNGGPGSGKSAIIGHFASGERLNWYSIRVQAGPTLTAAGLNALIAHELDADMESDTELEIGGRIKQRITALERAGKIPVLVVDDADQLLPEAISAIVRLAHTPEQHAELRVLMAADLDRSAVREALQRENPQHGLVHVVEIPPLTEAHVRALITDRLRQTGVEADDYFSDADYVAIAQAAGGLCSHVVTLARQHLVGHLATPRNRTQSRRDSSPSRKWPRLIGFGLVAVAAVVLGAWWATRKPATPLPVAVETVELTAPAESASSTSVLEEGTDLPTGSAKPASAAPEANSPLPAPASEPTLPPEVALAPAVEPNIAAPAPAPSSAPAPVLDLPEKSSPVPISATAPAASTASRGPLVPSKVAPPKQASVPKRKAPPAIAAPPISQFSAAWLLKQPATGHTLQLFGVRDRLAAERFIRSHGIAAQSAIMPTQLNGQPWYIVVFGYYSTRAAALGVIAHPPVALRDTKPWARSIGSLRTVRP